MTKHWIVVLCSIGVIGLVLNCVIFFPGYMSPDTVAQLGQALKVYPLTDSQPLVMIGLWRFLIALTGHSSSMLILQLMIFWSALTLLALYIHKETKQFKLSLLPFLIAILPFVLNISGVIWKDNQMAFSLSLAVVGCLYFKYITAKPLRWLLFSAIACLVMYACLVRYNALLAVVPLLFLAIRQSGLVKKLKWQLGIVFGLCGLALVLFLLVGRVMHVQSRHPDGFVMLDDIVNVSPEADIRQSRMSDAAKEDIEKIQECAVQKKSLVNNYWVCANDQQRASLQTTYYKDIRSQWLGGIIHHPVSYLLYKVNSYSLFLFPPKNVYYVWQDGIVDNEFGKVVKFSRLGDTVAIYVNNFGYKHFSFFFEPWFWAMISIGLLVYLRKINRVVSSSGLLLMSALLYLVSYFPTGATVDYRFIYWSVIADLFAIILLYVERKVPAIHKRAKSGKAVSK